MQHQSLWIIQLPPDTPVCQLEDFPQGTARSVEGALHIRPGTMKVTAGELAHLKKKKPWGLRIRKIKKVIPEPPKEGDIKKIRTEQARVDAAAAKKASKAGGSKGSPKQVGGKGGNGNKGGSK